MSHEGFLRVKLPRDFVKVERYLLLSARGGVIEISPSNCKYLLVPAEIVKALKVYHGIDLSRKNSVEVECGLVLERQEGEQSVKLIYRLSPKHQEEGRKP